MFNFLSKKNNNESINDDNRIRGSLFGFFVGDAIGVPVEFVDRDTLRKRKVSDMREYGTHYQPKGTWSDDSSMVLATIDAINNNKKIDYKEIMENFVKWYKEAKYTPFNRVFDIGNATSSALNKFIKNPNDYICGSKDVFSNGNGSLMRILPISLYLHFNRINNNFFDVVSNVSSMTHAHIFSVLSCVIYTIFIDEYLAVKNVKEAYYSMQKKVQKIIDEKIDENKDELKKAFDRLIYNDISLLQENDIKSDGYVINTLESSFWCLLTTNNFTNSVLKAVNLGEDTDTVAAITGGLSGLIYGYNSIPLKWINVLQQKTMLEEYSEKFIKTVMSNKKIIDKKIVEDVINELKNNPEACMLIGDESQEEGVFNVPYSFPGEVLRSFSHYLYENELIDFNYVENYERMNNKKISDFSYEETLTALTKIFRGDRFISGHLYVCFKNGSLLKVVEKLYSFINK